MTVLWKKIRWGRATESQGCGGHFKLSAQGGSMVILRECGGFQKEGAVSSAELERPALHTGKGLFSVKHAEPDE